MSIVIDLVAVSNIFNVRFEQYRAKCILSDFTDNVKELFKTLSTTSFKVGSIEAGRFGCDKKREYLLITTKVGKFMLYKKPDDTVNYFCEESFSNHIEAMREGFGQPSGAVKTVYQINYIFAIPDSYL